MFIGPVNRIEGQASESISATGRVRRAASGELAKRILGVGDEPGANDDARHGQNDANEGEQADGEQHPSRRFDARA